MQRCPKCGYTERVDWPGILGVIAFALLLLVWILGNYEPRELRGWGVVALILFSASSVWRALKLKKYKRHTAEGSVPQAPSQ